MNTTKSVGTALAVSTACLIGCTQFQRHPVTTADIIDPPQRSADQDAGAPRNSYVTLASNRTTGMFPCSLAIARVWPTDEWPDQPDAESRLDMMPANQMAALTAVFDDTWSISGVLPITYPMLEKRKVTPRTLINEARAKGAGLCLIYSIDTCTDNDGVTTEIRGALFTTRDGASLARIEADAHVRALSDTELPPPARPDCIDTDRRHYDPWFLAHDRFLDQVRQCVLDFVDRDTPAPPPPYPSTERSSRHESNHPPHE